MAALLASGLASGALAGDRPVLEFAAGDERLEIARPQLVEVGWVADHLGSPAVTIRMDDDVALAFGDLTRAHVGEVLTISLCGQVLLEPVLRSAIQGGSALIVVQTIDEAAALSDILDGTGGCELMPPER